MGLTSYNSLLTMAPENEASFLDVRLDSCWA